MKVHASLKELLEDFTIKVLNRQMNGDSRNYSEFATDYASSNSLASVEPEPLAKNKDSESKCHCTNHYMITFSKGKEYCGNCGQVI